MQQTNSENKTKILLASSNAAKIADFTIFLGDNYKIETPVTLGIEIDVPEGITSIEDNALAKAKTYVEKTGLLTIGDDTGLFIEELNGEPGVALRRWGGQLSDSATNEEFWKYLQEKVKDLKNTKCYFKQCVAIVAPSGKTKFVYNYNRGSINQEKVKLPYNGTGFPMATAFEAENRGKTWVEMGDDEKRAVSQQFIEELNSAIREVAE